MRRTHILASAALLLAGCGGGGSSQSDQGGGMPPPPPTMADSFIATLVNLVTVQADDTEPAALSAEPPPTPEDSEPIAVSP